MTSAIELSFVCLLIFGVSEGFSKLLENFEVSFEKNTSVYRKDYTWRTINSTGSATPSQ